MVKHTYDEGKKKHKNHLWTELALCSFLMNIERVRHKLIGDSNYVDQCTSACIDSVKRRIRTHVQHLILFIVTKRWHVLRVRQACFERIALAWWVDSVDVQCECCQRMSNDAELRTSDGWLTSHRWARLTLCVAIVQSTVEQELLSYRVEWHGQRCELIVALQLDFTDLTIGCGYRNLTTILIRFVYRKGHLTHLSNIVFGLGIAIQ